MAIFELDTLVLLLVVGVWVWALFDCISTESARCRNLPKGVWVIIVLLFFVVGAAAWLLLGRPQRQGSGPGWADYSTSRRPVGLEDSPRYQDSTEISDRRSRELDAQLDEWERRQREGEQ